MLRLRRSIWMLCLVAPVFSLLAGTALPPLVYQTDFGLKDGAVAAMKGVAYTVEPALPQFDLTHEIPAFDIWQAAYRLKQAAPYWPSNTVFVSVVDPGVGTERKPVVARARNGQMFVTPDNGTLTFIAESPGIAEVREIDMNRHRMPGSAASHTFHGRDLFTYVAARLAASQLAFADVGPVLTNGVVAIHYTRAGIKDGVLSGGIPVLDVQFGNVWSNIPAALLEELGVKLGGRVQVAVREGARIKWQGTVPYVSTFGAVPPGRPLLYVNSLLDVSLALNQDSFAARHHIGSGADWSLEIRRADR